MGRLHERRVLLLAAAAACVPGVRAPGEERAGDSPLDRWVKFYTKVAGREDFRLSDRPGERLKLEPKPVLVYSHPSGLKGTHGAFYVWTRGVRPEVVGSIWSYEAPNQRRTIVHELDSLGTVPLVETKVAGGLWTQKRVITPQPIPEAPAPGKSARVRASQIKQLAGRFEGTSMTNEVEIRLRMLPKPLYQFASDGPVGDGSLFCFFADWDPEIVLLIESRQTPDGPRWHYSPARFNVCPMWLDYEKKRVWRVEREPNTTLTFGDPDGPFFAVHEVASQPSDPEAIRDTP